jgi:hypothetical protein
MLTFVRLNINEPTLSPSNNNQLSYVRPSSNEVFISNESGSLHYKCLKVEILDNVRLLDPVEPSLNVELPRNGELLDNVGLPHDVELAHDVELSHDVELPHDVGVVNDDTLPNYVVQLEERREKLMEAFDEKINTTRVELKRMDYELKRINNELQQLIETKEKENNELLKIISEEIRKWKYNKLNRNNNKKKKSIKRIKQ